MISFSARKLLLLALTLAIVAAGCGTALPDPNNGTPFPVTDWCYYFNFTADDYDAVVSEGAWTNGVGFYGTANLSWYALALEYTNPAVVQPVVIEVTIARHAGVTGDINFGGDFNIFGLSSGFSQTLISAIDSRALRLYPATSTASGSTASLSWNSSDLLDLVSVMVWGNGVNPFPSNSCANIEQTEQYLTGTPTQTLTPSASPTPTATPTTWVHVFDLTLSLYGANRYAGNLVSGLGMESVTDPFDSRYETVFWMPYFNRNWSTDPTTITYMRVDYENPATTGPAIYFSAGTGNYPTGYVEFHTYQSGDGDQSFVATGVPFAVPTGTGDRHFGFALVTEQNKHVKYKAYTFEIRGTGYDPFTALTFPTNTPTPTPTQTWFLSPTPTPQPSATRTPINVSPPPPVASWCEGWSAFAANITDWNASFGNGTIDNTDGMQIAVDGDGLFSHPYSYYASTIWDSLSITYSGDTGNGSTPAFLYWFSDSPSGASPQNASTVGAWETGTDVFWQPFSSSEPRNLKPSPSLDNVAVYAAINSNNSGFFNIQSITFCGRGANPFNILAATSTAIALTPATPPPFPATQTLVPFPTALPTASGGEGDEDIFDRLGGIGDSIGNFFAWAVGSINNFFTWVSGIPDWLAGHFSNLWGLLGNVLQTILTIIEFVLNLIRELVAIIQLLISIIGHLLYIFQLWLNQLITLVQSILAAYYSAFPTPIPGLPNCVGAPMQSDTCAFYYIAEYTLFSGDLGGIIMTIILVLIDLSTIFYFIHTVKAFLDRAKEVTET